MSDVAAINNLVQKHAALKKEIAKNIIVRLYWWAFFIDRCARVGKDLNGKYDCPDFGTRF